MWGPRRRREQERTNFLYARTAGSRSRSTPLRLVALRAARRRGRRYMAGILVRVNVREDEWTLARGFEDVDLLARVVAREAPPAALEVEYGRSDYNDEQYGTADRNADDSADERARVLAVCVGVGPACDVGLGDCDGRVGHAGSKHENEYTGCRTTVGGPLTSGRDEST